ncbi:hypothetical protein ACVJGD_000311 [Bradyrhizobium sp. USDA 10063]
MSDATNHRQVPASACQNALTNARGVRNRPSPSRDNGRIQLARAAAFPQLSSARRREEPGGVEIDLSVAAAIVRMHLSSGSPRGLVREKFAELTRYGGVTYAGGLLRLRGGSKHRSESALAISPRPPSKQYGGGKRSAVFPPLERLEMRGRCCRTSSVGPVGSPEQVGIVQLISSFCQNMPRSPKS